MAGDTEARETRDERRTRAQGVQGCGELVAFARVRLMRISAQFLESWFEGGSRRAIFSVTHLLVEGTRAGGRMGMPNAGGRSRSRSRVG